MMLKKFRYGFSALVLAGLLSGFAHTPILAQAVLPAQGQSGFESLTPRKLSTMPNNSLLSLQRQLTLLANKRSLPSGVRAGAKAKLPLVNAEIKRRGIGGRSSSGNAGTSGGILAVLNNYRQPSRLSDKQLKNRLRRLERVIDARGVKKKWKRKARAYRASDLAELQRRKNANANPNNGSNGPSLDVLRDRRPLNSLTKNQLKRKIIKLQAILNHPNSKQRHIVKARRLRQAARVELRSRNNAGANNGNNSGNNTGGNTNPNGASILSVLNDQRAARSLNDTQLLRRLARLERVIDARGVKKRFKRNARLMRARDRAELDRRRRGGSSGSSTGNYPGNFAKVLNDQRSSRSLSDTQLLRRLSKLERIIDAGNVSPRWKQQARIMRDRDQRERRRRNGTGNGGSGGYGQSGNLTAVLNDQRPARRLSDTQLLTRMARLERLIDAYGVSKRLKSEARSMRRRDQAEYNRRNGNSSNNGGGAGGYGNQGKIDAVLNDRRPARNLSDGQLRARVAELRRLMRRRDVGPNTRSRLSKKLSRDRRELRRRVAAQYNPNNGNPNNGGYGQPQQGNNKLAVIAQRLLNDYRSSRQLNNPQLRRRIKDARKVLLYAPLPPAQIAQIKRLITADRAEKRSRLFAARERRREKLADLRRQGRLRFKVAPDMRLPQSRDISGAEANDRMIRRQFLAGDGRSYAQKYSRDELARRPELTRRFGGIDIDTIRFGFNEYWVREEEVDELERMAITIERILAARPYEVFQIEGHTDAVGSDRYNLGLSRQRATAVKDALTKYFLIPRQSLITVGLGERYLKIPTQQAEAENRRVTVRRVTPLLR